jgi:GTP1/Obg family GTP-binding protein
MENQQNDELADIIKIQNIVRFIKCRRIRRLGHAERMQDTAIPKKMLYGKLHATRRRGRPKMRWLDDVSMDLRKMGVSGWKDRERNREAWRRVVEKAKAHPGL